MKKRFVPQITNLFLVLFVSVSPIMTPESLAVVDPFEESPSPVPISHSPLPAACHVVYPSKQQAQKSCPPDAEVIEWYDFWQGTRLGWACDCADITL